MRQRFLILRLNNYRQYTEIGDCPEWHCRDIKSIEEESYMSEVVRYSNTKLTCYCQIKLDSGERILISIATAPKPCVKVIKLIWHGMLPIQTIWEYNPTLAGGTVLQMDQTTPAYQGILRHDQERREDTDMDCDLGLCAGSNNQKATESGFESLHNSTDFECHLIRESVYFTSTYGSWLQN